MNEIDEILHRIFGPMDRDTARARLHQLFRAIEDGRKYVASCRHPLREREYGGYRGRVIPRMPLRYGSAMVEICRVCGGWQMPEHRADEWHNGPYRFYLVQAQIEGEEL